MSMQREEQGPADSGDVFGLGFRVTPGSETSPVRVEYLDGAGRVMHVRPGSGQELLMYNRLRALEGRNGATHE